MQMLNNKVADVFVCYKNDNLDLETGLYTEASSAIGKMARKAFSFSRKRGETQEEWQAF